MKFRLQTFSYRFAEQVLNSRLSLKQEIESILLDPNINIAELSRPQFNAVLDEAFKKQGWETQPAVFDEPGDPSARMDFLKERAMRKEEDERNKVILGIAAFALGLMALAAISSRGS